MARSQAASIASRFYRWHLGSSLRDHTSPGRRRGAPRLGDSLCRWHHDPGASARCRSKKPGQSADGAAREQALGRSRGDFTTRVHFRAEGAGKLVTFILTPGQDLESKVFKLLHAIRFFAQLSYRIPTLSPHENPPGFPDAPTCPRHLLSAKGYSINQLADIFDVRRDTIMHWLDRWDEDAPTHWRTIHVRDDPASPMPPSKPGCSTKCANIPQQLKAVERAFTPQRRWRMCARVGRGRVSACIICPHTRRS